MKVLILGAGITGRMAAMLFDGSTIIEMKKLESKVTANFGMQALKANVPILESRLIKNIVTIDGESATQELVSMYREKIGRMETSMHYGDFKMFVYEQYLYAFEIPTADDFLPGVKVKDRRTIEFIDMYGKLVKTRLWDTDHAQIFPYDVIINTLPLVVFLRLINFGHDQFFSDGIRSYLKHRPIYVQQESDDSTNDVMITNYVSDMESPYYRTTSFWGLLQKESLYRTEGSVKLFPGKIYNSKYVDAALEDLQHYGIYCFGRYARWDSKIHMHQTYNELIKFRDKLMRR